jgi:hypothetical protein
MPTTSAPAVDALLDALPPDRRAALAEVRETVLPHQPDGYEEVVRGGMISYEVPLGRYPATYNGKPLAYAALAAQKNHSALYLVGPYQNPALVERLREGFRDAGKRLDMGKSCVRFRTADDLALGVVGEVVAALPPEAFVAEHEAARRAARTS